MARALRLGGILLLVGLAVLVGLRESPAKTESAGDEPIKVVVLDPGHGGDDYGARGASGALEKDVVLEVAERIGRALNRARISVVYTRREDRFVPLPERTAIANRSGGQLYLSIHANASVDRGVRGPETYFLSIEASDDEARRVAAAENQVFQRDEAVPDSGDVVGAILSDLIRTEHLRGSSEIATEIQRELEGLPGPSRGVKQAPFVVLMGVNMPAALLEIGFLTHPGEEGALRNEEHQQEIAAAVTRAVVSLQRQRAAASLDEE